MSFTDKSRGKSLGWTLAVAVVFGFGLRGSLVTAGEVEMTKRLDPLPIGINLCSIVHWGSHWVWADAFMASKRWVTLAGKGGERRRKGVAVRLTPDGWPLLGPGQAAGTMMFQNIDGRYPAGRYVVCYQGRGRITAGFDARVSSSQPGRIELNVTPSKRGIQLRIDSSDPVDPIRNIKVWMPGLENAASPFHPLFLERIRQYKTLRFMNWMRASQSSTKHWADRTTLDSPRQSLKSGVALEYMIDLCNLLEAEPWFSVPHLADDDFVRNFAKMVKERLKPELKVYVEYSNEVWNGAFKQSKWAREQGLAMGLSLDPKQAGLRFYAQRSVAVFKIWEEVFGDLSGSRLVRVLGSQHTNPWATEQILNWQSASQHADALAIAPYFGGSVSGQVAQLGESATVDDVLRMTAVSLERDMGEQLDAQKALADQHGLRLIAYEGGQHLVGRRRLKHDKALTQLLISANRHPCMYQLYAKAFNLWSQRAGGDLFMAFNNVMMPGKFGSWGLLEYQDQPIDTAWKYRAVSDAIHGLLPAIAPTSRVDCREP